MSFSACKQDRKSTKKLGKNDDSVHGHSTGMLATGSDNRNMAVPATEKTEVERECQNNSRTGFFDPWRALSKG